jgi:serine/threonine protein kinase
LPDLIVNTHQVLVQLLLHSRSQVKKRTASTATSLDCLHDLEEKVALAHGGLLPCLRCGGCLHEAITAFHAAGNKARPDAERSLALRQLLGRFVAVCNAVSYAHSRGVIHRDLKPGNVVLGKHGETLVVDWGLARVLGQADGETTDEALVYSGDSTLTQAGQALGTPPNMSPEQAAGMLDQLGPASDVYSLGATLYHLLTGKPPFSRQDGGDVLPRVQKGDFPAPRVGVLEPRFAAASTRKGLSCWKLSWSPVSSRASSSRFACWCSTGNGSGASPEGNRPLAMVPRALRQLPLRRAAVQVVLDAQKRGHPHDPGVAGARVAGDDERARRGGHGDEGQGAGQL